MTTPNEFVTRVLGRNLLDGFIGNQRPLTLTTITTRFTQLEPAVVDYLEAKIREIACKLPIQYDRYKNLRIHKPSQVNIRIQARLRGFFAIQIEGLFKSLAFLLGMTQDGSQHVIRLCLLYFTFRNRDVICETYERETYEETITFILDNASFFPSTDFFQTLSEFLDLCVVVYKAQSHEDNTVLEFLPHRLKSNIPLHIMMLYEHATDIEASFYPLVGQLGADIDHTGDTKSRFFVSLLPSLTFQVDHQVASIVKQEPAESSESESSEDEGGELWEQRLDDDVLALRRNDNAIEIAQNYFDHNIDSSYVVMRCHESSNRFTSQEVENIFTNEWENFLPTQHTFLYIRDGEHFVLKQRIKKTPSKNPLGYSTYPYNQVFSNFTSPYCPTAALSDVLERCRRDKTKYVSRLFSTSNTTDFDISAYDQNTASLGKQQLLESYSQNTDNILHHEGKVVYVSGHQGSVLPAAFSSNYGSRLILNHGPSNVSIRVISRKYSFHLVENLGKTRTQPPPKHEEKEYNVSRCSLECDKNIFLCEHRLAIIGAESEVVTLKPNHMMLLTAGTMIQGVFGGNALLAILHLYLKDFPDLIKEKGKLYECKDHTRADITQELQDYADRVRGINIQGNDDTSSSGTRGSRLPSSATRKSFGDPKKTIGPKKPSLSSKPPSTAIKEEPDSGSDSEDPTQGYLKRRKGARPLQISSSDEEPSDTADGSQRGPDKLSGLPTFDPSEYEDSDEESGTGGKGHSDDEVDMQQESDEYEPSENEAGSDSGGNSSEGEDFKSATEFGDDSSDSEPVGRKRKSKVTKTSKKKTTTTKKDGWVCGKVYFEEFEEGEKYGRHKCGKVIGTRFHLKRHITRFDHPTRYKCKYCPPHDPHGFPFEEDLRRHVICVHFNKAFHQCTICSESCKHRWQLVDHYNTKHKGAKMPKPAARGENAKRFTDLEKKAEEEKQKKSKKKGPKKDKE